MTNILIVGVGGQGILTLARMLGMTALLKGLDVKISEIHGMAQRGGSVCVHLRAGNKIFSPLVKKGDVDWLIGMELIETCRYLTYTSKKARGIINERIIPPPKPDKDVPSANLLLKEIEKSLLKTYVIPADKIMISEKLNIPVNTVIFGVAARLKVIDAPINIYEMALKEVISHKYLDENLRGFRAGINYIEKNY